MIMEKDKSQLSHAMCPLTYPHTHRLTETMWVVEGAILWLSERETHVKDGRVETSAPL